MAAKRTFKVRLILYDQGRILLLQQTKPNGGNFTLVGGKVEKGEDLVQCLIRESYEEAGISIREKDLTLAHILEKNTASEQRLTLYFKASKWEGKLRSREPHKFKAVRWFNLNDLPKNLTGTVKHVLKQYRKGKMYSRYE
ncbi:MAG: hypothetical protein DHS20C18_30330 [Saprospiraceae bacterium]|nr:MAG: hypothetical protein DHS20C18_30330 [Saprospiraceae bacterium]